MYATGEEELFDYLIDPNEWFNLADDPQYADDKADLRSQLLQITGLENEVEERDTAAFLFHGGFEQDFNGWTVRDNNNLIDATVITSDSAVEGSNYARFEVNSGYNIANANILLEKGYEYTLSFAARSASEGSKMAVIIEHNDLPDDLEIQYKEFELGVDWNEYESTFGYNLNNAPYNGRLRLTFLDQDVYELDAFSLKRKTNDTDSSRIEVDPVVGDLPDVPAPNGPLPVIEVYPTLILAGADLRFSIVGSEYNEERMNVRVFNLEGKVVHATHIHSADSNGIIGLPKLQGGIYIVQISGSGMATNRKIVVQ